MSPLTLSVALALGMMVSINVFGQSFIEIPFGSTPQIDGIILPGEWADCDSVEIRILNNSNAVKVYYKHDGLHLHLAYLGHLESSNIRFPEVLLDIAHDRSASWLGDDWWFHVSATDCEYQGAYGNFANCQLVRPDWTGASNMSPGLPNTDTIEIELPFSTIGLDLQTTDTIGISFLVTNTATVFEHWPQSASRNNPSTWGEAVFLDPTTGTVGSNLSSQELIISPNPNHGDFTIFFIPNFRESLEVRILNPSGRMLWTEKLSPGVSSYRCRPNTPLVPGIYYVILNSGSRIFQYPIVVTP